jgi:hypothetical protein
MLRGSPRLFTRATGSHQGSGESQGPLGLAWAAGANPGASPPKLMASAIATDIDIRNLHIAGFRRAAP